MDGVRRRQLIASTDPRRRYDLRALLVAAVPLAPVAPVDRQPSFIGETETADIERAPDQLL